MCGEVTKHTSKHTSNQLPAPPALLDWLAARVCPFWLQSDVSFGEGTAYLMEIAKTEEPQPLIDHGGTNDKNKQACPLSNNSNSNQTTALSRRGRLAKYSTRRRSRSPARADTQ
jgi:hypothetical protein